MTIQTICGPCGPCGQKGTLRKLSPQPDWEWKVSTNRLCQLRRKPRLLLKYKVSLTNRDRREQQPFWNVPGIQRVIFELPKSEMDSDNAVDEIVSQIGEIAGYTNLSLYNTRASNMMLEIVFETPESIQKAVSTGISCDGMVYRGTPWVDEARKKTRKVNLTHIPLKLHQNLGEVIKESHATVWRSITDS